MLTEHQAEIREIILQYHKHKEMAIIKKIEEQHKLIKTCSAKLLPTSKKILSQLQQEYTIFELDVYTKIEKAFNRKKRKCRFIFIE
jgi:hypothetical protein